MEIHVASGARFVKSRLIKGFDVEPWFVKLANDSSWDIGVWMQMMFWFAEMAAVSVWRIHVASRELPGEVGFGVICVQVVDLKGASKWEWAGRLQYQIRWQWIMMNQTNSPSQVQLQVSTTIWCLRFVNKWNKRNKSNNINMNNKNDKNNNWLASFWRINLSPSNFDSWCMPICNNCRFYCFINSSINKDFVRSRKSSRTETSHVIEINLCEFFLLVLWVRRAL